MSNGDQQLAKRMDEWAANLQGVVTLRLATHHAYVFARLHGFSVSSGSLEGATQVHGAIYNSPNNDFGVILTLFRLRDSRYALHLVAISYHHQLDPTTNTVVRTAVPSSQFYLVRPLDWHPTQSHQAQQPQERKEFVGLKLKSMLETLRTESLGENQVTPPGNVTDEEDKLIDELEDLCVVKSPTMTYPDFMVALEIIMKHHYFTKENVPYPHVIVVDDLFSERAYLTDGNDALVRAHRCITHQQVQQRQNLDVVEMTATAGPKSRHGLGPHGYGRLTLMYTRTPLRTP